MSHFLLSWPSFLLRGVQEQHDLQLEQLNCFPSDTSVYSDEVYYEYRVILKNNKYRFKDINATNKCVKVYARPGCDRCVVRLLDFYVSKLPPDPPGFYLRPLERVPSGNKPWYCNSRVGVNKLKTFLSDISAESGVDVHYTNHSLRATAVTRMYNTGVPEKLIAEKSGHRSLKALRAYERTSEGQEKSAAKCIQLPGQAFNDSVALCPSDKENRPPAPKINEQSTSKAAALQQFSGLSNCTFNFYQS